MKSVSFFVYFNKIMKKNLRVAKYVIQSRFDKSCMGSFFINRYAICRIAKYGGDAEKKKKVSTGILLN